MKKIKLMVMAMILCLGASFAGCNVPQESFNLTIWHYYTNAQNESFQKLIEKFNNEVGVRENISVEGISKTDINALANALYASAEGKVGADPMPDMFTVYADTASDLDKMGKVAALDSYFSKAELDEFVPSFVEEGRFDKSDSLKIIPFVKSTEILMLNEQAWTAFKAADSSVTDADLATMEGVVEVSEKYYNYTDAQTPTVANDGKAFFGRDAMANYMIIGLKQLGIDMFSSDASGEPVLNLHTESVRKLFDNFYLPYIKGYFLMDDKFGSGDMNKGKTIAMQCSTSTASFFPKSVIISNNEIMDITAKVLPPVYFEGEDKIAVQQGAGMVVSKSSTAREAASAKFLKWINDENRNIDIAADMSYLPVKKDAIKSIDKIMESIAKQPDSHKKAAIQQVMPVAFKVVQDFQLFTNKVIKNGTFARIILEEADSVNAQGRGLLAKAKRDRATVVAAMASNAALGTVGKTLQDAIAPFVTDANFENWLKVLKSGMEEILAR